MENIYLNTYKKRLPITYGWLNKNGFRYSRRFSTKESEAWEITFPVYRSGDTVVLDGEIVVYDDGEVRINVVDTGSYVRAYWAPFFYPPDWKEHHPILEIVSGKIERKLKALGIKRKK